MKILFLIDAISVGGKERRMIELFKGLIAKGGYEITLVSFTPGVEYSYLLDMPINLVEFQRSGKKDLTIFSKLYRLIKSIKPDIIHSWGSMASFYAVPSLILYRKAKFINGIIADAPENLSIKDKHYLRSVLTYPFSDAIISNSFAGIKSYKAPLKKSYCIYNGMDLNRFVNLASKETLLKSLGLTTNDFLIGMVAAFEERKDHETVIRAAKKIQEIDKSIKILFMGDGLLRKPMEELAAKLELDNILFLGRLRDVENYVQLLNVGILATNNLVHGEGISNALIECMAMGKPIIGTAGGGTNELIIENENGFLIQPKRPDLLVEKILLLSKNRVQSEEMGKKGKKMAFEKFTVERMTNDFVDLYSSLLDK